MHCHLVSVEVSVKCGTNKRMKLDSLTLYQSRLKCLYTETVQRRRTVKHNRMLTDDLLKYIPDIIL